MGFERAAKQIFDCELGKVDVGGIVERGLEGGINEKGVGFGWGGGKEEYEGYWREGLEKAGKDGCIEG